LKMTYNELKTAAALLNAECKAGIKCVGIKSDVLESEFVEASRYFAGEAEKTGTHLSEELQAFFRDITGEELHSCEIDPLPTPAAAATPVPTSSGTGYSRTVTAETPSSVVAANVPVPKRAAKRKASARHPFADMELGHSFFVPCTEDRPDPAKFMKSTVASVVRKHSIPDASGATRTVTRGPNKGNTVPVMVPTKDFVCCAIDSEHPIPVPDADPITDGTPWGFPGVAGAGIWRIA
jgi:hypothetical protein